MTDFADEQEFLQNYRIHDYDVPLTMVDMAIFSIIDHQLQVLVVKRAEHPCKGLWALPGGFIDVHQDMDLAATAKRKLKEKTGVDTTYLEQVASFGSATRDPRGWSVTIAYMALLSTDNIQFHKNQSLEQLRWLPVKQVQGVELSFDHQMIFNSCYKRLLNKVQYSSLPVNLLPEEFTLSELQATFEIILDNEIEKKSFRRRVLDSGILQETGKLKRGGNRPAKLYKKLEQGKDHCFPRSLESKT